MPQININEIDQSIVNRVVSNNLVKVLVPGIASFGPVYDGTENSLYSFTDVTEFYKIFGYTEPEHNPIENDVSRIYATQLIENGAEVSFIRINEGETASFDIGRTIPETTGDGEDAGTPTYVVPDSVKHNDGYSEDLSVDELKKYKFCPQVAGIEAKYSGSFGNNLLVTFTPVTSVNVSMAYQYSVVSVYRAEYTSTLKEITDTDGVVTGYQVERTISRVHKLESRTISTNPNDPTYFEDVEFDFIIIRATDTARNELIVTWSNINADPTADVMYSGFPEIKLKYKADNGITTVYNADALMENGADFQYCDSVKETLIKGFDGLIPSGTGDTANSKLTVENINAYIWNVYNHETEESLTIEESDTFGYGSTPGILNRLYKNLNDCFTNYSDPYIYDFDFITSGGILTDEWSIKVSNDPTANTASSYEDIKKATNVCFVESTKNVESGFATKLLTVHEYMRELVHTRKDCVALCDPFQDWEPADIPEYVALLNSSYCTVHAPWCWCSHPVHGNLILMPPSFIFLHTLLSNLKNNVEAQKWFPPAGVTRATARIVKRPQYEIGSVLLDAWQNNTLHRVNPIMKLKDYGYVIYGQFTTYEPVSEHSRSALESLNVRLIANVVKKQIFNTCMKLAFEPNNSTLWLKFYDEMDKYLLFMKRNDGLYDYKIQMDESTVTTDDINELRCPGKVWIAPTRTAEFFDVDFILTDAGVTFGDEQGAE